jgi:hypothetical protein
MDGATAAGGRSCCLSSRRCPQSFLALRGIVWVIWGRFWRSRPGQNLGSMQVRTLGRGYSHRRARRRGADGSATWQVRCPPHVPQVIVLTGRLGTGPGRTGRRRSPARSSSGGIPERDAHPTAGAGAAGVACAHHGRFLRCLDSASRRPQNGFPPSHPHVFTHTIPRRASFLSGSFILRFVSSSMPLRYGQVFLQRFLQHAS